ncbi:MAG TPA: cytochrome c oxidase subunit 4 [Jatrophihabitantaceae bacterium]|jgi:1,4-dihydroxy-2-naphthoate octaprenyltransferase
MKVEARVFLLIAFFCWIVAIVYGFWSDKANGHVEVAGLAALILSGGLLFIAGSFFWFVSRRIDPRPEDRPDAEIAEGAGDLGFFSPGSYWPFALALAATMAGTGLAFFQMWLVLVAVIGLLGAIGGLLFEYYAGGRKTL